PFMGTCTKYVVSPPISVRRIERYDGERVTYHYRSHRTDRLEHETVPVQTFIGRMVQHVLPKGFKRIRYYGVQATKTFAKVKAVIHAALAKVEGVDHRFDLGKGLGGLDRKSTRLNSSHRTNSYAVFCLKKKNHT